MISPAKHRAALAALAPVQHPAPTRIVHVAYVPKTARQVAAIDAAAAIAAARLRGQVKR